MPEATPRPWPAVECTGPCDDYYSELYEIEGVAKFFGEADAELARRAVNSHDALVAALRRAKQFVADLESPASVLAEIDAAIAKAQEQSNA